MALTCQLQGDSTDSTPAHLFIAPETIMLQCQRFYSHRVLPGQIAALNLTNFDQLTVLAVVGVPLLKQGPSVIRRICASL